MLSYIMRPEPTLTITDLRDQFSTKSQVSVVKAEDVTFSEDELVRFTDMNDQTTYEVELKGDSMAHFADWLDIPTPFLKRVDMDLKFHLLRTLMERKGGEMMVDFTGDGILGIHPAHLDRIDPLRIVDMAVRVLGEDALVIDGWRTPKEFRFDAVVASGADHGIAGDPAVGDLTHGGLRFGQSGRLAPWVETFMYRLVCTNGMEVPDTTDRVSLQKMSVAEGLLALEHYANKAFEQIEGRIAAFYDLRNQKVNDASQMAIRVGREGGIANRPLQRIIETLPAVVTSTTDTNLFEIVNAITNRANHPDIWSNRDQRRKLETTGGRVVTDHSNRCPSCKSNLGTGPVDTTLEMADD